MYIQIAGLNHKTAPIEVRERISFSDERLAEALITLSKYEPVEEDLILSTCNRVEVYIVTKDLQSGFNAICRFLTEFHQIPQVQLQEHLYLFNNIYAIRHLFRVISSLDSMIVGETQILGQVKQAYFKAKESGVARKLLSNLFEEAIKVGKRVRTQTDIGKGAVSISSTSIELAKKIFENLEGMKILIIGTGKVGELAVRSLVSKGAGIVFVANRTFEKAQELARVFGGQAVRFEGIFEYMRDVDIIISSTSAPHFVINKDDIFDIMRRRKQRPIFLIDLGLPRNIEPQVAKLNNVYLYNIDDLAGVRDANLRERMREVKRVEEIIEKGIEWIVPKLSNTAGEIAFFQQPPFI